MHLCRHKPVPRHRRPLAYVHHAEISPASGLDPYGIHSVGGYKFFRSYTFYIGCGEPQFAAVAVSVPDYARQSVFTPHQIGGKLHIAGGHSLAHCRRAYFAIVGNKTVYCHHLHAQHLPVTAVIVKPLLAVMPETVVIAHQQHGYAETLLQYVFHEIECGQ